MSEYQIRCPVCDKPDLVWNMPDGPYDKEKLCRKCMHWAWRMDRELKDES